MGVKVGDMGGIRERRVVSRLPSQVEKNFRQIHFMILTNIFQNLDKYISDGS